MADDGIKGLSLTMYTNGTDGVSVFHGGASLFLHIGEVSEDGLYFTLGFDLGVEEGEVGTEDEISWIRLQFGEIYHVTMTGKVHFGELEAPGFKLMATDDDRSSFRLKLDGPRATMHFQRFALSDAEEMRMAA